MIDLDITGADPKDVEEYVSINEEIDTLTKEKNQTRYTGRYKNSST